MLQASNPFITTLYWTLQDPIHLFMVMEYMGGGDLFNQIKTNGVSFFQFLNCVSRVILT